MVQHRALLKVARVERGASSLSSVGNDDASYELVTSTDRCSAVSPAWLPACTLAPPCQCGRATSVRTSASRHSADAQCSAVWPWSSVTRSTVARGPSEPLLPPNPPRLALSRSSASRWSSLATYASSSSAVPLAASLATAPVEAEAAVADAAGAEDGEASVAVTGSATPASTLSSEKRLTRWSRMRFSPSSYGFGGARDRRSAGRSHRDLRRRAGPRPCGDRAAPKRHGASRRRGRAH